METSKTQYHLTLGGELIPYQWLPCEFPGLSGAELREARAKAAKARREAAK